MEKTKVTKKEYFEMIKGICADRPDIVNFCDHEIELLTRKSSKVTATKTQKENANIAEILVAELAKIEGATTITDLMNTSDVIKNYTYKVKVDGEEKDIKLTNQKISAIFKQLVDNKTIVKTVDKKKSYFSIAD